MEVIHSYTRADAIADGTLKAIPQKLSKEAGFKYPVAVTAAVYEQAIRVPDDCKGIQDETGRMWDILMLLLFQIRRPDVQGSELHFKVSVTIDIERQEDIKLKALCHPGDEAEPVITIMLPEED